LDSYARGTKCSTGTPVLVEIEVTVFRSIRRRPALAVGATLAAAALAGTATVALAGSASASDNPPVATELSGTFSFHACPSGTPAGDGCLTDHLTGTLPGLGAVTGLFEVHIAFGSFAADGCGEIDKTGAFTAADGSTLRVHATGLFCNASATAAYDYRVTGGTGRARHARGEGIWLVPPPATFDGTNGTGGEPFHGSLSL
jgi:hypothetical protein